MAKVDRAERARQQRQKEQSKVKVRPKERETEFDKMLKRSAIPAKPITQIKIQSKVATEHAIREAVKEHEKRGEGRKKDDSDKDEGRDSRQDGKKPQGKIADQKVIAKGKLKQGGGGSSGGGHKGRGGSGMMSGRRSMTRVLKKSGARSLPIDLKGKFAQKLLQTMKGTSAAEQAVLSQQVLNKIIQYVRMGINRKGEKEIQIDLHERIFRGLKLRIIARGGKVNVTFNASDKKGREVLEKNKDGILKALQEKGIEVDDIKVT